MANGQVPPLVTVDFDNYPPSDSPISNEVGLFAIRAYGALTELLSSILNGYEITYPDTANGTQTIMSVTDFCEGVADCIVNSESVRNAISEIARDVATTESTLQNPSVGSGGATEIIQECDLNSIYGGVRALWDYINAKNIDFLENLALTTNIPERLAEVIEAIPVVGLSPVDDIINLAAALGDYSLEAYNSSLTIELQDEIICELFCIAQENCGLDMQQVVDYFWAKLGNIGAFLGAIGDIVNLFITGTLEGPEVVWGYSFLQLTVVGIGSRFLGLSSLAYYALVAQAGLTEPSNEWTVLCEPCTNEWVYVFDFTLSDGGFTIGGFLNFGPDSGYRAMGQWVSGQGWVSTTLKSPSANYWDIAVSISKSFDETYIKDITINYVPDTAANDYGASPFIAVGTALQSSYAIGSPQVMVQEIESPLSRFGFQSWPYGRTAFATGITTRITSITVRGTGLNPFA